MEFFTFRWLFKRKTGPAGAKKSNTLSGSSSANQMKASLTSPGTATRLKKLSTVSCLSFCGTSSDSKSTYKASKSLKPSYSFDDVDQLLKISCSSPEPNGQKAKLKRSTQRQSGRFKSNMEIGTNSSSKKISSESKHDLYSLRLCNLCLMMVPFSEMHSIWSCGCLFCKNCLKEYLTVNIKENNNVPFLSCPDARCPSTIDGTNLMSPLEIQLLIDDQTNQLYKKFKLDWEINLDPSRTWCPTPNCDNICVITMPIITSISNSSSGIAYSPTIVTESTDSTADSRSTRCFPFFCHKCDKTFCSKCRGFWHPGFPCQSPSEDEDLLLLLQRSSDSKNMGSLEIKRCPRCSVWIERDEGCAQMMCRKCNHVFCWFCLQSLEDDFLLRHYDKGPCKNRLGHSRASVIWHRTQIIGIFAGFGVLLLLASPLFLIAAPCILCCNCCCNTSCKYIDDEDEEIGRSISNNSKLSFENDETLFGRRKKRATKKPIIIDQ